MDSSKLLVVDDNPAKRAMLSEHLARGGYSVEIAGGGAEAVKKLRDGSYDVILVDQAEPSENGVGLLALLRATVPQAELPVILAIRSPEHRVAGQLVDLGNRPNSSIASPGNATVLEAEISQTGADRAAIYNDPLTGLSNRGLLMKRLESALAVDRSSVALILLDLDGFKLLNASFGQRSGDLVLASVADRLQSVFADAVFGEAVLARIGGDEFAVLARGADARTEARSQLESMAAAAVACFERPFRLQDTVLAVTASVGGALCAGIKTSADELWREADLAMRRAKDLGKNRWKVFDPSLRDFLRTQARLGMDLRHALERNELVAYYQPKIHLPTQKVVGFEALLRWKHPAQGLVPPIEFIPLAEELGLIAPIGEWILTEASRQLSTWQTKFGRCALSMNVNLSAKQLHDPRLVEHVRNVLNETGIDPKTLKLELTESALMTEIHSARETLSRLSALGVGLKLDDFGTGYSSLNYLRTLHFDALKIDRSFVSKLTRDPETQTIVATIIDLAHRLHMDVVAEGIETEEQLEELIELGCDTGQGFYFSRPLPADQAELLLQPAAARQGG